MLWCDQCRIEWVYCWQSNFIIFWWYIFVISTSFTWENGILYYCSVLIISHSCIFVFAYSCQEKKIGDGGGDGGNDRISMATMIEANKDFVNQSFYFVSMSMYCAVFRFTTGRWHDILHWIRLSKMSSLHLRVRAVISHRIGTTGLDPTSTAWWNMHM